MPGVLDGAENDRVDLGKRLIAGPFDVLRAVMTNRGVRQPC
jgi:hypothetical protein